MIAPATTRMTLAVPRRRPEQARRCRTPCGRWLRLWASRCCSSVVAIAYTNTIRDAPGITRTPAGTARSGDRFHRRAYEVTGGPSPRVRWTHSRRRAFRRNRSRRSCAPSISSLGAALLILIAFVALLMRLPAQAEHAAWGGRGARGGGFAPLPDAFEGEEEDLVADAEPTPVQPLADPKP